MWVKSLKGEHSNRTSYVLGETEKLWKRCILRWNTLDNCSSINLHLYSVSEKKETLLYVYLSFCLLLLSPLFPPRLLGKGILKSFLDSGFVLFRKFICRTEEIPLTGFHLYCPQVTDLAGWNWSLTSSASSDMFQGLLLGCRFFPPRDESHHYTDVWGS